MRSSTAWLIFLAGAGVLSWSGAATAGATPPPASAGLTPPSAPAPPPPAPPAWGPPRTEVPPGWPAEEPSKRNVYWYGWQILIPGAIADGIVIGGVGLFFANNDVGIGWWITGAIGHAISGPIVHLANGQPGKAAVSFLIDGILPGAALTGALVGFFNSGKDTAAGPVLLLGVFPFAWVAGLTLDISLLARKEVKPEKASAISLAPLALPKVRANSSIPVGLSLVGRF